MTRSELLALSHDEAIDLGEAEYEKWLEIRYGWCPDCGADIRDEILHDCPLLVQSLTASIALSQLEQTRSDMLWLLIEQAFDRCGFTPERETRAAALRHIARDIERTP